MRSVRIAAAAGIVAAGLTLGAAGMAQAATPTAVPAPSPSPVKVIPSGAGSYPTPAQIAQAKSGAGNYKVAPQTRALAEQQERSGAAPQRSGAGRQRGVSATYRVTASRLNVRSGPGTGYHVVGSLPRGARVAANTATVNGFREMSAGHWVSVHYLAATR